MSKGSCQKTLTFEFERTEVVQLRREKDRVAVLMEKLSDNSVFMVYVNLVSKKLSSRFVDSWMRIGEGKQTLGVVIDTKLPAKEKLYVEICCTFVGNNEKKQIECKAKNTHSGQGIELDIKKRDNKEDNVKMTIGGLDTVSIAVTPEKVNFVGQSDVSDLYDVTCNKE